MLPKIIKAPASVLSVPCKDVDDINTSIVKLAKTMALVTRAAHGAGLAANQIGYSKRMFTYMDSGKATTLVNPLLVDASSQTEVDGEGCLSIPGKTFSIERPTWVKVSYLSLDGNEETIEAEGFLARCFMHELDHLSGRLLNDGGIHRLV